MPWIVKLTATPTLGDQIKRGTAWDYRAGYFPRKIHYKKDALELQREVEGKGGKAEVVPAKKGASK